MKEIFDVSGQLLNLQLLAEWKAPESPDYKLIANAVRTKIVGLKNRTDIEGFQFMITLEKGLFEDSEHQIDFVSSFEPIQTEP